jgi:hypothetical protein
MSHGYYRFDTERWNGGLSVRFDYLSLGFYAYYMPYGAQREHWCAGVNLNLGPLGFWLEYTP